MFRQLIAAFVCVSFLAACAGRTANPVMVTQFGDASKTCKTLIYEMQTIESEMQILLPKADKTGQNVALGVAGAFLLVPWFFMDFSQAEQQEYNAYRQRYNYLATIAMEKGCDAKTVEFPSIEEMKAKQTEENRPKNRHQR